MFRKVLFSDRMKKAHIISIGNELLIGDTVNTNASLIGSMLTEWGFYVEQVFTIPDSYTLISSCARKSIETADLTIITGGLGPTHDDITKKALADFFGSKLIENSKVLKHVQSIFEKRGFLFSKVNAEQALVPDNCEVLFNIQGTAPGMWFEHKGRYLAVLPGVPHEMKYLMEEKVQQKVAENFPGQEVWQTEYFKTAGVPESTLSDQIGDLSEYVNKGVGIAYLPNAGGVTIRISASGKSEFDANKKLVVLRNVVRERAGGALFGTGKDVSLAEVTGDLLRDKIWTIASAESCTGGLLSSMLTDVAGSSDYVEGGIVTYSNRLKIQELGVKEADLNRVGAVSKEVALQMAKGAALKYSTNIGVSTTGIAGPGGGTKAKPVGTVWMGFWINGDHFALHTVFTKNRLINKQRTVLVVLDTVRRYLLNQNSFPYNLQPHRI